MKKQWCIVVTKSLIQEDAVRKRLDGLEVVRGSRLPVGSHIQKTTYFRTQLSVEDKAFLTKESITYFGDEDTAVGVV
jgi:hypothetical protein